MSKLQILVIPLENGFYSVYCNQDDFQEVHETQILAIIAGADHRAHAHPKEDAKVGRRSKAAAKHRKRND